MNLVWLNAVRASSTTVNYLVRDTFTISNGVLINSRSPDIDVVGGGWIFDAGSFSGSSSKAVAGSAQSLAVINSGQADVTVADRMTVLDNTNNRGIALRRTSATNYWRIDLANGTLYRIVQIQAGSPIVRASAAVSYSVGASANLRVVASGNTITAYVSINGGAETSISYGSATFNNTATYHGIYSQTATTNDFHDNFEVYL